MYITLCLFFSFSSYFLLTLQSTCPSDQPWPSVTLFLPMPLQTSRNLEWEAVFLQTFFFFWPIKQSQTKILFMLDLEEVGADPEIVGRGKYSPDYKLPYISFKNKLAYYSKKFNTDLFIATNNVPRRYWKRGHTRPMLVSFYADQHITSDFVGFVDTDCQFITYIDRSDLLSHDNKPIIRGRTGKNHWAHLYEPSSTWLLGGALKSPSLRFMNYFPVLFKTSHVKEIREYIEQQHNTSFNQVYIRYADKFGHHQVSHWDVMCTYLWHFHRGEYTWYVDEVNDRKPSDLLKKGMTMDMIESKPHIAVHTRYQFYTTSIPQLLQYGYCASPGSSSDTSVAWRDCSAVAQKLDETMAYYMHSFEYARVDFQKNLTGLIALHRQRQELLAGCKHDWNYEAMNATFLDEGVRQGNPNPDGKPSWLKLFMRHRPFLE